jgi:hypothetical protein
MAGISLEKLANRTIALEFEIGAQHRSARGLGSYEWVEGVGYVLRIHVADPSGDFDLILSQDRWSGTIVPDTESGCDYRIRLHASDLCLHL